jgi:hypothetical protein
MENQIHHFLSKYRVILGASLGGFITGLSAIFITQCLHVRALILGAPPEIWLRGDFIGCFISGIVFPSAQNQLLYLTRGGGMVGAIVTGLIVGLYSKNSILNIIVRSIIADLLSSAAFLSIIIVVMVLGRNEGVSIAGGLLYAVFIGGWIVLIYMISSLILTCLTGISINRIMVFKEKTRGII